MAQEDSQYRGRMQEDTEKYYALQGTALQEYIGRFYATGKIIFDHLVELDSGPLGLGVTGDPDFDSERGAA